ncbi:MAG: FHA domain-containing protein [Planctomycetes bacterium]|nr:FHA domain-containing protein [Planctomycetota bacterium]
MIKFRCDCGKKLGVREELSGKRVRCTGCGEPVLVPSIATPPPLPPEAIKKSQDTDYDADIVDEDPAATKEIPSIPVPGARLVLMSDHGDGQTFALGATAVLGRQPTNEVPLDDEQSSREHARIEFDKAKDRHVVSDLGSRNGTFVNDEPVTSPRVLNSGDLIRVGFTNLRYEGGPSVAAAAVADPDGTVPMLPLPPPCNPLVDTAKIGPSQVPPARPPRVWGSRFKKRFAPSFWRSGSRRPPPGAESAPMSPRRGGSPGLRAGLWTFTGLCCLVIASALMQQSPSGSSRSGSAQGSGSSGSRRRTLHATITLQHFDDCDILLITPRDLFPWGQATVTLNEEYSCTVLGVPSIYPPPNVGRMALNSFENDRGQTFGHWNTRGIDSIRIVTPEGEWIGGLSR